MLETIFTNPAYLAAGGALVSAPIIIHLINRMRFKRLRWAAMEFLLKSQKRNRRRLIIEQLILLMLRCTLVMLATLLVLRYVATTAAGPVSQKSLHVVVLDDTLSMGDQWKEGNDTKTCFKVAKDEVLGGLVKALADGGPNDRLVILPLSKLVTEDHYEPTFFHPLNDDLTRKKIKEFLAPLQPTNLHVDILLGVTKAQQLFADNPDSQAVLHVVSDFRQNDWGGSQAEGLYKKLRELHAAKVKILPRDTAAPYRARGQRGIPQNHDNVAIIDFHANTRVVGKGMPVTYTITLANYGSRDESVNVAILDPENKDKELQDVDFEPQMPLRLRADSTQTVTFERREYPEIKATEKFHARRLKARLESGLRAPLEGDALAADNVRYASVEIRKSVPVLVIDGDGAKGREEGNDSFHIQKAIESVPGGSYEVVFGDQLAKGGTATRALERDDLAQFPSIFLLNVRELTDKQLANLEKYAAGGGGVAFFLGPNVLGDYYTDKLYKNGRGVFPAPLRANFYPPRDEEPRVAKLVPGNSQLLVRDDLYGGELKNIPIFKEIFTSPGQLNVFEDLPVRRYFQVPRSVWEAQKQPGKVFELATLPNDVMASDFAETTLKVLAKFPLADKKYEKYRGGLQRYADTVRTLVAPGSEHPAYELGETLRKLLTDKGTQTNDPKEQARHPNLTEFWESPDPNIRQLLRGEVEALKAQALFGDPFVVAQNYGKGRVVAVMSTAGKAWNDWGGGSLAQFVYQPFIWRTQSFLSSQGADAHLTVGTPISLEVNSASFREQGKHNLRMVRTFYRPQPGQAPAAEREEANHGREEKGVQTFLYNKTFEPGWYHTVLFDAADPDGRFPLAAYEHVYNVDAEREGQLRRLSNEEFQKGIAVPGVADISGPVESEDVVDRRNDLSEKAWFFLFFVLVLVAEQALAVHLSYHLRAGEGGLSGTAAPAEARAA